MGDSAQRKLGREVMELEERTRLFPEAGIKQLDLVWYPCGVVSEDISDHAFAHSCDPDPAKPNRRYNR
jgi:hypothetical protein